MKTVARCTTRLVAALALVAIPATRANAQATATPSVAIVFPDRNALISTETREYDGLSKALSSLLAAELSTVPGLRVVEREQVRSLVGTVPVDRETAVKIGGMVGAQHTVYGSAVADAAGNLRVDARAVSVASGAIEYTDRLQDRGDNVQVLVHRLASRLATAAHLPAPTAAMATRPLPYRYVLMFGHGLDLADHGDRAGAAAQFDAVLRDYPDFEPARVAASRLR